LALDGQRGFFWAGYQAISAPELFANLQAVYGDAQSVFSRGTSYLEQAT
jgi:hypothetical protein